MRLTSLSAENVLSFVSFETSFEPGLNVIVGPNGAGKSNVVRAVRLIRTALDIAIRLPQASIDMTHQLRIGSPDRHGIVRLGVGFAEEDERIPFVAYIRALVASSWERQTAASPSVDNPLEQQIAARVRSEITESTVSSLLKGQLVLVLDDRPPVSATLGYEFEHAGQTYHYGLIGPGMPLGWVGHGPFKPARRTVWSSQQLNLGSFLTDDPPASFSFADLLPASGQMTAWEVRKHSSGQHLLLSEELADVLGVEISSDTLLPLNLVLHHVARDRIILTENLRRPPRATYALTEVGPPVTIDDAGDLPLELYRRRVSQESAERQAFVQVQELYKDLTGHQVDITASIGTIPAEPQSQAAWRRDRLGSGPVPGLGQGGDSPGHFIDIRPVISVAGGDIPVENAGAGAWEALVACAHAVPIAGRVVLLDEPAVNMHPTWQRRFLGHLATLDQAIVVTHSPYLIPGDRVEDLDRITRLRAKSQGTVSAHVRGGSIPSDWKVRWRQSTLRWTETRASLLAQAVILLEGDTELGVFGHWFSNEAIVGDANATYDALNLQLFDVASDKSFGSHVSFLKAFDIPWVIICDGPVLSPRRETNLLEQLRTAGLALDPPDEDAPFEAWKAFWEAHGVFTVADRFGDRTDRDKSGEIEAFFERIDGALWQRTKEAYPKSKTRAGYAFAETLNLESYEAHLLELRRLWTAIKNHIGTS